MRLLYADATPSDFEHDLFDAARRTVQACCRLLEADLHLVALREELEQVSRDAGAEMARIEALGRDLLRVLEPHAQGRAGAPSSACAEAVTHAATAAVGDAIRRLRSGLAERRKSTEARDKGVREAALGSLESLLLVHDLPGARGRLAVRRDRGRGYGAELEMSSTVGITAVLALAIPAESAFAKLARGSDLADGLALHWPESGSWWRRPRSELGRDLGKLCVCELVHDGEHTVVRLRRDWNLAACGVDLGLGEAIRAEWVDPARGERLPLPVRADDGPGLRRLQARLLAEARELADRRAELVCVTLDATPLGYLVELRALAVRLIEAMAPALREVDRRGGSGDTYRAIAVWPGGRREPLQLAKAELRARIDRLPPELRGVFAPLALSAPARRAAIVPRPGPTPVRGASSASTGVRRAAVAWTPGVREGRQRAVSDDARTAIVDPSQGSDPSRSAT